MPTSSRSDDAPDGVEAEVRPYLGLAREIHEEVSRLVTDEGVDVDALAAAIARFPDDERARVTRDVFLALPVERQWEILGQAFGDEEIRAHLDGHRREVAAELRRERRWAELAAAARLAAHLDVEALPPGTPLTIGLFREADVRAALARGHRSDVCARQLGLRVHEPGVLRVIDDVFNPRGGYFVTSEYDEHTWRTHDRLPAHALVRVGSATGAPGVRLEPVLYPGGRVDVEVDGRISPGRLHLGFAMLGTRDVFAG